MSASINTSIITSIKPSELNKMQHMHNGSEQHKALNKNQFQKILKAESIKKLSNPAKHGIDNAAKEIATQLEQQFSAFMWNLAFATTTEKFEGGIGEELFRKELVNEMITNSNAGTLGELAEEIYNEINKNTEQNIVQNTKEIK